MPEIIQSRHDEEQGRNRDDKNIKIIFFIYISRYALFIYMLIYFYMHEHDDWWWKENESNINLRNAWLHP